MTERVECAVIGAGVVGLAVARALAMAGREVVVIEAEPAIGTGISARSSEVIHAGLYYPPGSAKARLCVRGKALLYDYCVSRGVPHRRIGKLIVATDEGQRPALDATLANARACGVHDLERLDAEALHRREPAIHGVAALWSPGTGIVDSHALMIALLGDAEAHGATLALASPVTHGRVLDRGIELATGHVDARFVFEAGLVVDCAGLAATLVARSIEGVDAARIPATHFAKGNYFTLTGRAPFSHLIYPLPEPGGLGLHLTLDLGGQARFGPDVQWLPDGAAFDYAVDEGRAAAFTSAIRKYWPDLPDDALVPAYAGIRPKLSVRGAPAADFVIAGPRQHGTPGLVQLFGIESPGLTSSLAIAEEVVRLATDRSTFR